MKFYSMIQSKMKQPMTGFLQISTRN